MKKIGTVVGIIVLLFVTWNYIKAFLYHTKISLSDVEEVTFRREADGLIKLKEEQQKDVVEAFNKAKFIEDNDQLAGPTYMCGASIQLKSGKSISIRGCGRKNEVQRDDNIRFGNKSLTGRVAYIIESKEMEQIFEEVMEKR